ncbi:hypothetical protein DBV15_03099 [Temnothorax longispinosus]|uniref:Uncharacterized protein n=1 Tax=Temnothorax longispinosus TaxID=300112 RepID=A0A4S2KJL1_9HYME|nr:hypothetical protein DBV15_03099 [Temnothorax longispinosus]
MTVRYEINMESRSFLAVKLTATRTSGTPRGARSAKARWRGITSRILLGPPTNLEHLVNPAMDRRTADEHAFIISYSFNLVVRQQNHIELNPFRPVKLPTSPRSLAAATAAAAAAAATAARIDLLGFDSP